jgi:protein-S-isoprenylcysteine O-methyltransferase Ste14
MQLFPQLSLGWLNGWVPLVLFFVAFGAALWAFPRDVVARLYDRSNWTRWQRVEIAVGKLFSVALIVLLVLTPLQVGKPVFVAGCALYVLGSAGFFVALFSFARTPAGQPVERGLYRVSRNPQWVGLVIAFLGACVACGSWVALFSLLASVGMYHIRLLAEERSCLALYGDAYRAYMARVPRYFWIF